MHSAGIASDGCSARVDLRQYTVRTSWFDSLFMTATDTQIIMRKWMCVVCGFIYDEAEGLPEEGIPPGTRWEDIPDTWTCPDCGVTKDDFEMIELD